MVNGIDINAKLEPSLRQLHGADHQGIRIQYVRDVVFAACLSSDGFIGTSHCGDFSLLGSNDKIGLEGESGGLFQQQLEFIRHLAQRPVGTTEIKAESPKPACARGLRAGPTPVPEPKS